MKPDKKENRFIDLSSLSNSFCLQNLKYNTDVLPSKKVSPASSDGSSILFNLSKPKTTKQKEEDRKRHIDLHHNPKKKIVKFEEPTDEEK